MFFTFYILSSNSNSLLVQNSRALSVSAACFAYSSFHNIGEAYVCKGAQTPKLHINYTDSLGTQQGSNPCRRAINNQN